MKSPRINSFTNWGKLEEVWLGDCYPSHFYDNLESEVRDVFYEITQKTQEDLDVIHCKLEEFGVQVHRPRYDRIEDFLILPDHPTSAGQLRKPMITPRDHFLVFGNTLYGATWDHTAWADAIAEYSQDPASQIYDRLNVDVAGHINGANTVRVGLDLYLDTCYHNSTVDMQHIHELFKDYRLHLLDNGGHVDSCFAVLKPGVLLTSKYFDDYDRTFPGWHKINISKPEFYRHGRASKRSGAVQPGKWWLPGATDSAKFNDHVIKHAQDWVGDYTETYFEVNCLVIDEKNVFILGENEEVFRELERHGITAHSLPFRTRTFWDGGLHCITLDIRRQDSMVDLFPERTEKFYAY